MTWRVELTNRARRDLRALDNVAARRVIAALDRLAQTGSGNVRSLQGSGTELRLRVGSWRVLLIFDHQTVSYKCSEFCQEAKRIGGKLLSRMGWMADRSGDEIMKTCLLCGGNLVSQRITHPQNHKEEIFILENVPADVCRQCGEELLRPDILELLQDMVWKGKSADHVAELPAYDFAEIT